MQIMKHTETVFSLDTVASLRLDLVPGDRVFLRGDLGAGKTTLSRHLLASLIADPSRIKSPTYVYYNRYGSDVYHFDLYRMESYDDFVNIGAEEIFDDPRAIILVEWPELLGDRYAPTVDIRLSKVEGDDGVRRIEVTDYRI